MQWRKQYAAFSKTTAGQAAFFAGLFVLCYTGLLFRLLNLLFILWWLAPLVILPLLNAASRQASILFPTPSTAYPCMPVSHTHCCHALISTGFDRAPLEPCACKAHVSAHIEGRMHRSCQPVYTCTHAGGGAACINAMRVCSYLC